MSPLTDETPQEEKWEWGKKYIEALLQALCLQIPSSCINNSTVQ